MLLSLVNYGLLNTSESIDLESIFCQSPSLIKDHHIYSSRHVDSLRGDAVDFIFPEATDCKSGACCHCCGKCWRDSDSD